MKRQDGFSAVEGVLIFLIAAIVGFAGWQVYKTNSQTDKTQQSASESDQSTSQTKDTEDIGFMDESIHIQVPKTWEVEKRDCAATGASPNCVDGTELIPPEKMPTTSGDGSEPFTVYIGAYQNSSSKTAQKWFEEEYMGSASNADDDVSSKSINSYDTYYFKQVEQEYTDINYVVVSNNKVLLITARITESPIPAAGSTAPAAEKDFTRYLPEITSIANSVTFK